ncbi:hypothetical protein EPUS_05249 [Endocarpon pusillum Z07020]|uniref:Uncharacterized protein n=1 Tax=Endocarpon pusillum (strain Z07020 / HMAS-L-300199) TaxID=1263415 RepID=U1G865_ENDPU|nr:uncharacterized protein EPUS_05249 [Endocarpon pusillum Z07020]ERF68168.1 hypothetical protein EPUS_05249 [Endocarpon pusillum Z07020]
MSRCRAISLPRGTGDAVDSAELSRIERQNDGSNRGQMQLSSLYEQKNVPHGTAGSQQATITSRWLEGPVLRRIGAQFEDNQLASSAAHITDNSKGGTGRHQHHESTLHRVDISRGTLQASQLSNLHPMERFLLEASSEQPTIFAEPIIAGFQTLKNTFVAPPLRPSDRTRMNRRTNFLMEGIELLPRVEAVQGMDGPWS